MKDQSTILITDDDPIFLGIAAAMVRNMGYPVITALNGHDAIESFTRNKKDIYAVLLDLNMPGISGVDVLQRIRALCKKVHVVIVSGCLNDAKREELSSFNPAAYIEKPISFDALSGILNTTSHD